MKLENLYEKRSLIANEIEALGNMIEVEKRDFNADENNKWEKLNKDYAELTNDINRGEKVAQAKKIRNEVSKPINSLTVPATPKQSLHNVTINQGFNGWLSRRLGNKVSSQDIEAAKLCGFNFNSDTHTFKIKNTLKTFDGAAGGYAVDTNGFVAAFEKKLSWFGGMAEACRMWNTTDGRESIFPQIDDVSNVPTRQAEEGTVAFSDPTLSQKVFRSYDYGRAIKVSRQWLRDADSEAQNMLGELLGEACSRVRNTLWTTGTGVNEPTGLTASTSAGVTTASATAFTLRELNRLIHSVDFNYRTSPKAAFMMSDTTLEYVEGLLSATNQFNIDVVNGYQRKILGYPIVVNNDLPAVANGAPASAQKLVYFGDFSKFICRFVGTVTVEVLRELYSATNQVGLKVWFGLDSGLVDAGGGAIKHLLQA